MRSWRNTVHHCCTCIAEETLCITVVHAWLRQHSASLYESSGNTQLKPLWIRADVTMKFNQTVWITDLFWNIEEEGEESLNARKNKKRKNSFWIFTACQLQKVIPEWKKKKKKKKKEQRKYAESWKEYLFCFTLKEGVLGVVILKWELRNKEGVECLSWDLIPWRKTKCLFSEIKIEHLLLR